MEPLYVVLLTLLGVAVLKVLVLLIVSKGSLGRVGAAWRAFRAVAGDDETAAKVQAALTAKKEAPKPVRLSSEPVRLLAILQREARLLDFLLEDIAGATNDQIGAGVREVHKKAQAVLREHLTLEPVLNQAENSTVEVPPGFDPSAIRLTGNVTGQPPFKGTLIHHGWRVKAYNLPKPPEGQDDLVVSPAEVEL